MDVTRLPCVAVLRSFYELGVLVYRSTVGGGLRSPEVPVGERNAGPAEAVGGVSAGQLAETDGGRSKPADIRMVEGISSVKGLGIKDKWELLKLYQRREKVFAKLGSRKLWAAVLSSSIITLGNELGIDEATSTKIAAIAVGYMLSQGVVDAVAASKGKG